MTSSFAPVRDPPGGGGLLLGRELPAEPPPLGILDPPTAPPEEEGPATEISSSSSSSTLVGVTCPRFRFTPARVCGLDLASVSSSSDIMITPSPFVVDEEGWFLAARGGRGGRAAGPFPFREDVDWAVTAGGLLLRMVTSFLRAAAVALLANLEGGAAFEEGVGTDGVGLVVARFIAYICVQFRAV